MDHSNTYIVYQGYMGQFNWRRVDADGETVRDGHGQPISNDISHPFLTQDDAKADILANDPTAQIELRRVANFDETVDDAEEREELEAN
jgi:hypothetical protein